MRPRRSLLALIDYVTYPYRVNLLARNVANELPALTTIAQKELVLHYQERRDAGRPPLPSADVAFRVYSEADEDGLLVHLFALIGFGQRRCVDIGASPGSQSNTANLILHHGFRGLLIEANPRSVAYGRHYYAGHPDPSVFTPAIVEALVTPRNVNELIGAHGFGGEIDLLSIDIDGLDYWVWQALDRVQPRVVLAEINHWWPADRSVTVPNRPGFVMPATDPPNLYHGASLGALLKLARTKGYRLVACNNRGYNVFFMRDGVGEGEFPAISPQVCLPPERFDEAWRSRCLAQLVRYEWVEI